jgi:di/tricarboxylate transporter
MALTVVGSMWMSNTATAALVLPLALPLLEGDQPPGPAERACGPS